MNWDYPNDALWSIGNGLTTGTLIIYPAKEICARGLGVSLVLAVPSLVGLLRLFSPSPPFRHRQAHLPVDVPG